VIVWTDPGTELEKYENMLRGVKNIIHKTKCNGVIERVLKVVEPLEERVLKMMWRKEVMKMLNMLKETTWRITVGWFDFYHFYVLDSIISLQIIFLFFYQNS